MVIIWFMMVNNNLVGGFNLPPSINGWYGWFIVDNTIKIWMMTRKYWLVVEPCPSEKWWSESQLGWWNYSNIWKVIKFHGSSHHQPEVFTWSRVSINTGLRTLTVPLSVDTLFGDHLVGPHNKSMAAIRLRWKWLGNIMNHNEYPLWYIFQTHVEELTIVNT